MLSIAIVAIAWCAYQATLWHTVQTFKIREVNADTTKYVMKTLQQGQRDVIGMVKFSHYSDALIANDQNKSKFYYDRFLPDVKTAVDLLTEVSKIFK